jgi:hypothetical protein
MDQHEQPENADRSFMTVWHYEGREIPIKVVGPFADEEDHFVEIIADFVWKYRHLALPRQLT